MSIAEPPTSSVEQPLDPVSAKLRSLQLKTGERRGGGGRKWRRWFLLLLLIGGLVGAYFGVEAYKKANADQIPVTEAVTFGRRGGGDVIIDVSGYVVPRRRIAISPLVGGMVTKFDVEEGDEVKEGDVLFEIEVQRYEAEMARADAAVKIAEARLAEIEAGAREEEKAQARAEVAAAQANFDQAKKNKERNDNLLNASGNSITDVEYEQSVAAFATAEAQLKTAQAALSMIEKGPREEQIAIAKGQVEEAVAAQSQTKFIFDNAKVTAPFAGKVLEKNAQVGERIYPEVVVRNLCVIADMNDLEAEVDIQERYVGSVSVGHKCRVIIPGDSGDLTYEAELARMPPRVERQRGVVPVKVKILDPHKYPGKDLLADMNCRVLFLKTDEQSNSDVRTVPSRAIVMIDNVPHVFVPDTDGRARKRRVETGRALGDEQEILSGIEDGEVVLLGTKENPLKDGQEVKVQIADEAAQGEAP